MNKRELRCVVVETAQAVMDARGHDPEIRVQVAALIASLDGALPAERVLQELEALKARGPTFQQILADFPTLAVNAETWFPRLFPSDPRKIALIAQTTRSRRNGLAIKSYAFYKGSESPIVYAVTNLDFYHSVQQDLFGRGGAESTST